MLYNTSAMMQPTQSKSGLTKNKSVSQLQQHLSQTARLQRGRGYAKKQANNGALLNQSNSAFGHPVGSLMYKNFQH